MIEPAKAAFSFENFRITNFAFLEQTDENDGLSLHINPSGTFFQDTGAFEVKIDFTATEHYANDESTSNVVEVTLKAMFRFAEQLTFDNIPNYFYLNSIAIAFPYLRAFISSLTLQANLTPLILPVLNLTGLDEPLRENTTVVINNE